jgi:putative ABC transport system substrate-binding protein
MGEGRMRRREFATLLGLIALTEPIRAVAQRPPLPIIGYIRLRSPADGTWLEDAFREGLKEVGYVDGTNITVEYRWADSYDQLTGFVTEFVKLKAAVIVARGTPVAVAAKSVTSSIPIVYSGGGDPVKLRLVKSLNEPGGNVTGISNVGSELEAKRIQSLRDLLPGAKKIGYLVNPRFPAASSLIKEVETAGVASATNIRVINASTEVEIAKGFSTISQSGLNAILVAPDSYFISRRDQIVALAERYAIPACYPFREFAVAGGLMSYGADRADNSRRVGIYTARILKGTRPADLPVVQSDKFELVVNRKTAKKLGLTLSRDFLLRADEVIE